MPGIQRRLLDWYAIHQRALPWRRTTDPYAILVSEIMLQQTQVDRVVTKYHEFLARFPSISDLAAASRADVIRAWSSLGYNRRAVRLHELAQHVTSTLDGALPRRRDALIGLPGLGPYTAAAVACFAFGEQLGLVDTNIRRVLGRLLRDRCEARPATPRELARAAEEAVAPGRAADWNQALMDLGATTCTVRAPACWRCPVAELCASRPDHATSLPELPRRAAEPRLCSYRSTQAYKGSSRFYRGRIVAHLRELTAGATISLAELERVVLGDGQLARPPSLVRILEGLESDGLVRIVRQGASEGGSDRPTQIGLP